MKKKNIVVMFSLILLFLSFHYTEVLALTSCGYELNGEKIFLTKEDTATWFDKVTTSGYTLDSVTSIKLNDDGTCPYVSISSPYAYAGFNRQGKIYSSLEKCKADKSYGHNENNCSLTLINGQLLHINDQAAGNKQAILVEKSSTKCVYQAVDGQHSFTMSVASNNGSGYRPDFSCEAHSEIISDNFFYCELSSDGAYFYGFNEITNTTFICPKYLYYDMDIKHNPNRYDINIIGSGGEEDPNVSGITSEVQGDIKGSTSGPLEPKDLDCNGIFKGRFGQFLMEAWKLIKFAVPILIIAFAIVDFVEAMSSHDEAEVKKAANKLVKRLVIGVLIFVLPTIIEYILGLAGIEFGTCDIK